MGRCTDSGTHETYRDDEARAGSPDPLELRRLCDLQSAQLTEGFGWDSTYRFRFVLFWRAELISSLRPGLLGSPVWLETQMVISRICHGEMTGLTDSLLPLPDPT